MMNLNTSLNNYSLQQNIEALAETLKSSPMDQAARNQLSQMLCLQGEFERADKHLQLLEKNAESNEAIATRSLRQLLRAAQARSDFFTTMRSPEFLEKPDSILEQQLQLVLALHEGDVAQAESILKNLRQQQLRLQGSVNGNEFIDFVDLDDRTAYCLELLSIDGKYYWTNVNSIETIDCNSSTHPLSLIWREAHIKFKHGLEQTFFIPTTYFTTTDCSDEHRLGHASDWIQQGELNIGSGQRMWLIGDDAIAARELQQLKITGTIS